LALIAATRALDAAALSPKDIDGIIFATVTPDQILPSASCLLQTKLGCRPVMAFDLSAACSGFIYGLSVGDALIRSGQMKNVLVVGAEVLSRIMDYTDRETCILFGDGAGAVVLGPTSETSKGRFLSFQMSSNGGLADLLTLDNYPSARRPLNGDRQPDLKDPYVQMKGREIFKSAVTALSERCREALNAAQLDADHLDWVVPHQANRRIVESVLKHVSVPMEKCIMNLAEVGNTSSASIPIAFDEAVRKGSIRRGQKVIFTAFGAGLTSGAALFEY
jgi:3-oxoacyl-[acyl-carrier-protein] synthase-3